MSPVKRTDTGQVQLYLLRARRVSFTEYNPVAEGTTRDRLLTMGAANIIHQLPAPVESDSRLPRAHLSTHHPLSHPTAAECTTPRTAGEGIRKKIATRRIRTTASVTPASPRKKRRKRATTKTMRGDSRMCLLASTSLARRRHSPEAHLHSRLHLASRRLLVGLRVGIPQVEGSLSLEDSLIPVSAGDIRPSRALHHSQVGRHRSQVGHHRSPVVLRADMASHPSHQTPVPILVKGTDIIMAAITPITVAAAAAAGKHSVWLGEHGYSTVA